ncbi:probable G-protein coupled receptor 132 [Salminus brasiliensis]|uniref:probable G-protein coupled receptor 132 n=1 Tax=Salminus brasiliensis TaxID=930266 RepID=UPI003B82F126
MAMTNGTSSPNSSCLLPYDDDRLPLLVVYSIVLIVGLPANMVTVYLTFLQVRRQNVLGIYLLSLSVCDLMYLGTLPMWTIYINSGHRWNFGSMACKITGYIFFNNMYISIFLLCCVSLDRYVAVIYPIKSRVLRKRKRAVIVTIVIVAVVALGHMPVFTMTEGDTENKRNKRCFEPGQTTLTVTGFNYARFVIGFFIPLCVLVVTNHAVLTKVEESDGLRSEQKTKVRYLAVAVILFFLVCFTPYHVILLLRAISYHFSEWGCDFQQTLYTSYTISLGLSTINSAMNPVLYVLASDNIRKEIYRSMSSIRSGQFFRTHPSDKNHSLRNSSGVRSEKVQAGLAERLSADRT